MPTTPPLTRHIFPAFAVNGTNFPLVDFDIGESYAGRLPITVGGTNATYANSSAENELFFWFFPSTNALAGDEIVIWLNGGPGCSSMDGLLQENGPFLWQSGTYSPRPNPFAWTNLTNVVWIDQPIGTGLSSAAPGAPALVADEADVARDFAGFWRNFVGTFDMQGRSVYITGESYAGMYVPYIASYFLDQNDTAYYGVAGIQVNDPSIGQDAVLMEAPAASFLAANANLFNLNDTFAAQVQARADACGYGEWMDRALTFPPAGKFPAATAYAAANASTDCDVWDDITLAALYVNPCFNFYHVTDFCPFPSDELGFPSLGWGPNNYFNRSDVQAALHVAPPGVDYAVCGDGALGLEHSPPSSYAALPSVVERTNNVVVGNGLLDFLIMANGTLATLNNMTWNGAQGFQTSPFGGDSFFVPYNPTIGYAIGEIFYQSDIPTVPVGYVAGGGVFGNVHTERGLTFVTVSLAGHEIPQYVPGAAYRQLEFLLGRIDSLTEVGDFTTAI